MPTSYPKCSPTEMLGLLVLLDSHHGSEDVALLADDLDLEIDEIFPALEYAEILQLVKVTDGRATFTDLGKRLLAGTIRSRKATLREQLRKTTLFKTLVRALESAPEHQLSDHDLAQIVSLTTTPSEEAVQNIINWGRYADLFRYDADSRRLLAVRPPAAAKSGGGKAPPPSPPSSAPAPGDGKRASPAAAENPAAKMARASA
ncbi:MAG: AAA-associated domain-containing protein [Thermoplasmata archaeon]